MLKISTMLGAFISSWNALLERQARLTFLECMTSFKCQETFLWPDHLFAIGRTLFTIQMASAWLAMKCQSYTSIRMRQRNVKEPCPGFLPRSCQKSFPPTALFQTGWLASKLSLCLHPLYCWWAVQHFTSYCTWKRKWHKNQEYIFHLLYHNWVFVPYQKGCFSSMLVSKKKYPKLVFLVHLSSRQIDLASQFYNTRVWDRYIATDKYILWVTYHFPSFLAVCPLQAAIRTTTESRD